MEVLKDKRSGEERHCIKPKNTRLSYAGKGLAAYFKKKEGFGMNELLGIAAALIIAAFIIIPGLRNIAQSIMTKLQDWWNDTIVSKIFTAS
ncbi:MAG TPA: hypothetical protein GXX36_15975 [Clostridiaceae bacterium]|nr:hypothetical protein [Clostridiaceae bacterium]